MTPTSTRRRRRGLATAIAALALTASGLTGASTAQAAPSATDVVTTFAANPATLGTLVDATEDDVDPECTMAFPGVKDISVPVSGVTTPITDVRVGLSIEHTYLSDLTFVLIAPNGTQATFVDRVANGQPDSCNYSSNLSGAYTFFDGAAGNLAGVAAAAAPADSDIPAGSYAPVRGNGASLPLTSPFTNLGTAANGTWTIRIIDGYESDTGSVSAASLTLATQARSETVGCKNATAAAAAAQAAIAPAAKSLAQAKKKLKKAKKSSAPTKVKAKKVKKAKKRVKAAKASLAAAKAAATSTASARTTAC